MIKDINFYCNYDEGLPGMPSIHSLVP